MRIEVLKIKILCEFVWNLLKYAKLCDKQFFIWNIGIMNQICIKPSGSICKYPKDPIKRFMLL